MMALTDKQMRFAELMAAGRSQKIAAESVGVTPRTARSWLRALPELRDEIDRLSRDAQGQAVRILSSLLTAAAATLAEMLKPEHPDQVRLSAARGIFADFTSLRTVVDLAAELDKIKVQIADRKDGRRKAV